MPMHYTNLNVFSVLHVKWKAADHLLSLLQHLQIPVQKWMKLFLKNLKVLVIPKFNLTVNSPTSVFILPLTLLHQAHAEMIYWLIKKHNNVFGYYANTYQI